MIKALPIVVFLLLFTQHCLYAQDGSVSQQQIQEWNNQDLKLAELSLKIPDGFTEVVNRKFSYYFMDKNGAIFTVFKSIYINRDTSIAIGLYFSGNRDIDGMRDFRERAPNLVNNYVDTLKDEYSRLDPKYLAEKWHTNYGVSFTVRLKYLFMDRFLNNRMFYIANKKADVKVVYFYKDEAEKNVKQLLKRPLNILEPIK